MAIEMAEEGPPNALLHPFRAMSLVASTEYRLADPSKWSPDFVNFVDSCLKREPNQRLSAEMLLEVRKYRKEFFFFL